MQLVPSLFCRCSVIFCPALTVITLGVYAEAPIVIVGSLVACPTAIVFVSEQMLNVHQNALAEFPTMLPRVRLLPVKLIALLILKIAKRIIATAASFIKPP